MRTIVSALLVFFLSPPLLYSQSAPDLNMDFEKLENSYPTLWNNFGSKDYKIYTDSLHVQSGKYAAVIEGSEENAFKALAFTLPNNYKGKLIKLSGYIKTENVEGFAGLWMRIDPQVAFDNMNDRGIKGTTGWKKYEITLPLSPGYTDQIVVGGLLSGSGKMWLDNLEIHVDGKKLGQDEIKIYTRKLLPAHTDKEFDGGSAIAFAHLDEKLISNLEILGKVWGFLKYHHPKVGKGSYNWDYELFRILPEYLKVGNNVERDLVLSAWIQKYGPVKPCKNCKPTAANAVLSPSLVWIEDSKLSNTLKAQLTEIYKNRHQGKHFYIGLHAHVGNPDFTNENAYIKMAYPDDGFRLLSLFRYWSMIEYFYPNKHLTTKKWNSVLKEYIPQFVNAKNELEYELSALKLIGEINDTHANLWGGGDKLLEYRGNNYAPFRSEFIEHKLVVTEYYTSEFETDVKIGDIITHIDGKAVSKIVDSLKPFYPASNEAAMLRNIAPDLLRSAKSSIDVEYESGAVNKKLTVPLYPAKSLQMYSWYKEIKDEKSYKILDGNIGYVTLANIKMEDVDDIKTLFKQTKGIIIDIRNYPSAFVPFKLGSYFVSKPTPFAQFTKGNINNPGEFTFTPGSKIKSDGNRYKGKLVILVNQSSQSASEYTAMAFRAAENSTVIGSTTAGADGNESTIWLPGGLRTMISGIGVYYPDGSETQRIGIVPDIIVKPSIEGIKKGVDEVLEKAIQTINQ